MKRYNNNSVLLIPDIHAPYHHKDAIKFILAVADKYSPDRVFQMGDLTDSYCFSRYPKDIEHTDTYTDEYRKVRKFVKELTDAIPEGRFILGNHDARIWERAKSAGVPRGMLIPFEDVTGISDTNWKTSWDYTFTVDANKQRWFLVHDKGANVLNVAKTMGINVAQAHQHNKLSIESFCLPGKRIYGVFCGTLLGDHRYATAYNRKNLIRPNRGLVVIERGVPKIIPFELSPKGNWNGVVA